MSQDDRISNDRQPEQADSIDRGPAYRIETERLVLRCWSPADAPRLKRAIDDNLDHLWPWLPWIAHEPEELAAKVQRLREFRGKFDLGLDFVFAVFEADETRLVGGCGLHPRLGPGVLEIGYWIHKDTVGRGYATELAAALTRVGFEIHRVGRIEIRCDPENLASAGVPRKLGFHHDGTLRRRLPDATGQPRDLMVWSLFRDELLASPVAAAEVRAFDVSGEPFDWA
ncbi:MAG: GNAT family N-acetyltransferase [Proteobacteria bacterium]|nr:GNAT family N-acetyltransferase [Pseudomonadota bacterium]